jgi:signal transduction histidine kinase
MRRSVAGRLLCAGLLILMLSPFSADGADVKRVLLLHSSGRELGPFDVFTEGFREELDRQSAVPLQYYEASLEPPRAGPSDEPVVHFLQSMFADRSPDLIVPIGGPASKFAVAYRQRLFPAAPMLLAAVDQRHLRSADLTSNDAVVAVMHDAGKAIEDIQTVLPKTRTVFVVIGDSPVERFWREDLGREFQRFQNQLTFIWGNDLSFAEMLKRCGTLPPNSAIFYALLSLDAAGFPQTEEDTLAELHKIANAPIFGVESSQLGLGIVGGPLMSMDDLSRNAAGAAIRILNRESPEGVRLPPQLPGPSLYDWRELRRWDIDENRLPPGSIVQFREPTLWQRYKWYVLAGALVCFVESVLIWSLLANLRKRRRAEHLLLESRNRLSAILETAGEGIMAVDDRGVVESVNAAAEKMFGFAAAEMIGHDVNTILPVGLGEEVNCRRKDGSSFPVELERSEVVLDDRRIFTYFVRDMTERKRAEQMVLDFGKQLLRAQEAERARLARELHDDITQRLARLALDSGRVDFQEDKSTLGRAMYEVHDEIVRLSEDVHALAYRLHPALLERLGLANALRVECEQFSRQEPTRVNIEIENVAVQLPQDLGLCLFRVTQEALRNVSRHARAATVDVSLRPSETGLRLTVKDNGVGFHSGEEQKRPSLGLASMRERVRLLGGRMTIESEPGRGTALDIWVPFQEVNEPGSRNDRNWESHDETSRVAGRRSSGSG